MKILLINKFYYLRGGAERVFFNTKKLLEEKGHEVVCFSMKDARNEYSEQEGYFAQNVDYGQVSFNPFKAWRFIWNRQAAKQLEKLIKAEKPDVAHLHNVAHQLTYSILKPLRKYKIPIVQTLHDYQYISPNYNLYSNDDVCEACYKHKYFKCVFKKCLKNSYLASLLGAMELYFYWIKKFYKKIDIFISPSQFLKDKYQKWGFDGKIEIVNNSLELKDYQPDYAPGEYLLYFGRLSKEKGIITLARAMKKNPDITLKIIGDGPQREKLEKFIEVNKIKNIELLASQSGEILMQSIRKSRIVILPSEWYENYPMAVVEAMALGKPVIGARIGGLSEMIKNESNGWLFTPGKGSQLAEIIKNNYHNQEKVEKCGRAARLTVEKNNSTEIYYHKLLNIYETALNQQKSISLG